MRLPAMIIMGLAGALFAGCVTSNVPPSAIGSGAFIRGVDREKTRKDFAAFYLDAIDGASVDNPAFRRSFEKPIPIGPGERLIVVHYEGMDGDLTKRPRIAQATLKVKIEPGLTYIIDGRDEGVAVYMWISRADTGAKVTDEVLAAKTDMKIPTQVPLIIPIPLAR